MKQWERHANDALRALGEAYQLGRISRDTYRERRRRLMASFRDHSEVTARRAVSAVATEHASPSMRQRDALPLMFGSHWVSLGRWGLLLVLAIALVAAAVVLLGGGGTNG